jgi:hypothetical protein
MKLVLEYFFLGVGINGILKYSTWAYVRQKEKDTYKVVLQHKREKEYEREKERDHNSFIADTARDKIAVRDIISG